MASCRSRLVVFACFLFASFAGSAVAVAEQPRIDFGKQIRPLLAERCFECHGPENQEGNLRLDRRHDARRGGDGGILFPRDKTKRSLILERLESSDPDQRMPLGKKPLTRDEIEVFKRWIEEGAEWPDAWSGDAAAAKLAHWSFQPPTPAPLPSIRTATWIRSPIDSFVVAHLEQSGLAPSDEAGPYSLVRRLYFDLLGLPPTADEADAFANDSRPDAYERVVDRLLSSHHYGERWARRWLDLARYADTNGYEKDRPRSIWPFRDWVVQSLNADMPFDQFTIRQLAGDLLPNPTTEDLIATGFHRNTMQNEEGGIDPLEFRFHAVVDRANTTGTVWLGLTVGCAQCHSHKYDPLQHQEYYQLLAFFNNCDEVDIRVPDARMDARRIDIQTQIDRLTADLPNRFELKAGDTTTESAPSIRQRQEACERRFKEWAAVESARAANWVVLHPVEAKSNLPLLTVLPDDSVLASGDQTKSDTYDVKFKVQQSGVTAIRLEALPHDSLPLNGPGRAYYEGPKGDFFLSELKGSISGRELKFASATHDFSQLSIGKGENGALLSLDGNTTTGWSTSGREGEPHAAVYNFAEPTDLSGDLSLQMIFERHFACGLGRFRISLTTSKDPSATAGHSAETEAILAKPESSRSGTERDHIFKRFLQVAPELAAARAEIAKLQESIPKPVTSLVLMERPAQNPRETHVHYRGEYLQPKQVVAPDVPAFLPPLDDSSREDRLGFVQWLLSPGHPLTARVTVNRQWQSFFGRGLVRTTDDFGLQGELPSHPKLLDWLALEFASGNAANPSESNPDIAWSVKRLHRRIVTSATYRQGSRISPELHQRDPQNVLLARGPRSRLDAEMIRDSALQVAGLLSTKVGGPGVFPPQPTTITTEGTYGALPWTPSPGEDRFRRSLYTYSKRTAPFAMYATFDAPSGEACLARREISNSPLQALTLLNDTIVLEAAQALGNWTAAEGGTSADRADRLLRRCLARPATATEIKAVASFAERQKRRFANHELEPAKIATDGAGELIDRATWTLVARAILNFDETITKR